MTVVRLIALGGLSLVLTWARQARAESSETPAANGAADEGAGFPPWAIRLGLLVGFPVSSDQEELLRLEGYGSARFAVTASVAYDLDEHFALGVLGLYGWRASEASVVEGSGELVSLTGAAPTYRERTVIGGIQAPIRFALGKPEPFARLSLTPWAGVGAGWVKLPTKQATGVGPAFGGSIDFFFPSAFVGFAAGAYFQPHQRLGEAAGHGDFGMWYLALFGGFDAG